MSVNDSNLGYSWWNSLNHEGLLISPSKLRELFPENCPPLSDYLVSQLRKNIALLQDKECTDIAPFMDFILESVLGLDKLGWLKGPSVGHEWGRRAVTGETIKPRRIWQKSPDSPAFPVFTPESRKLSARLGRGAERRTASRIIEWLRKSSMSVALLTNGRQWRLIYAGADFDAWCEWDISLWFEEGYPSGQLTALRVLLNSGTLSSLSKSENPLLLKAILESRKSQAEMSSALGENVRSAVELLIQSMSESLASLHKKDPAVSNGDIYIAANRIIMRLVVALFAESRNLMPLDNLEYFNSYSINGLREYLDRLAGGRGAVRLRHGQSAWPRLLGLSRLIYFGSEHPSISVPRYGGILFRPGNQESGDHIEKAVAAFEKAHSPPSDAVVHQILELLCRSKVKIMQGRSSRWVAAPVDFSSLSTEYIGMLYEGLLDFELRRTDETEAIVFLNIGDQPALPLSRLEEMPEPAVKSLFEKLKKKTASIAGSEEDGEEADDGADENTDAPEEPEAEAVEEVEEPGQIGEKEVLYDADKYGQITKRIEEWTRKAVILAGIVPRIKGKSTPDKIAEHEEKVNTAARLLVANVVMPGHWFLVRWGGTRKGSGTFYTRPQLAGPLVRRTLEPLVYEKITAPQEDGKTVLHPKEPGDILAIKICDPGMGSASFLIASTRYLTDVLWASLFQHKWLAEQGGQIIVTLPENARPKWFAEMVRDFPVKVENADIYIKNWLKRVIVENCIYGVDINPLAVELAKLAMWIETMDYHLPFSFLDHKLKCGNSLVGCWFDYFREYPVMAWEREGGDKSHSTGVHFQKEQWTKAIKKFKTDVLKPDLSDWLDRRSGVESLPFESSGHSSKEILGGILEKYEEIHGKSTTLGADEWEDFYRKNILDSQEYLQLKFAFDTWCAIWFWPPDKLDSAPKPTDFHSPGEETRKIISDLSARHQFFHWELEFPDVFRQGTGSGFSAMLGNPPWEIKKPNSKEFFSNIDPLYRSYGKQEANNIQKLFFEKMKSVEKEWLQYSYGFKANSNWCKSAGLPYGDPEGDGETFSFKKDSAGYHTRWRALRISQSKSSAPQHPFIHQGSADINTYKLFLELGWSLIRSQGRMGFIVPSGVYTDKGSTSLRELFLSKGNWEWLFSFENRKGIFNIHRSFKFCPLVIEKGGETKAINCAFMRHDLDDWENAERFAIPYPREQVRQFSPHSKSILELQGARDLEILKKIYSNSILLGDDSPDGWGIKYATEFHMTNDSKLFPPRPKWEEQGYIPDEYGHWLKGNWQPIENCGFRKDKSRLDPQKKHWSVLNRTQGLILSRDGVQAIKTEDVEDVALPLYEGRMIGQFDFSEKGWVSGKGRSAVWREILWESKVIEPQYLMSLDLMENERISRYLEEYARAHGKEHAEEEAHRLTIPDYRKKWRNNFRYRLTFMDIASATNMRTMICSTNDFLPCGNSAPVLKVGQNNLLLAAILNSYSCDFIFRNKCGGLHLNYFVIEDCSLIKRQDVPDSLLVFFLCLNTPSFMFSELWEQTDSKSKAFVGKKWAFTSRERLRMRCILDAAVAELYGMEIADFAYILKDCDWPLAKIAESGFTASLNPKGFWRVDKDKPPELRHTVLSLVAFHELKKIGIEAFLNLNDGEGWMLPEKLRLADYSLGHDDRAKEPQPVASALGPRFLPWQLETSPEDSWEECRRHAENIKAIRSREVTSGEHDAVVDEEGATVMEAPAQYVADKPKLAKKGKKTENPDQGDFGFE